MGLINQHVDILAARAATMVIMAKQKLAEGIKPTDDNINDMSELASDLIEYDLFVYAGRVDKALVDWCGLLLDA
jgi:hypothetical protein